MFFSSKVNASVQEAVTQWARELLNKRNQAALLDLPEIDEPKRQSGRSNWAGKPTRSGKHVPGKPRKSGRHAPGAARKSGTKKK